MVRIGLCKRGALPRQNVHVLILVNMADRSFFFFFLFSIPICSLPRAVLNADTTVDRDRVNLVPCSCDRSMRIVEGGPVPFVFRNRYARPRATTRNNHLKVHSRRTTRLWKCLCTAQPWRRSREKGQRLFKGCWTVRAEQRGTITATRNYELRHPGQRGVTSPPLLSTVDRLMTRLAEKNGMSLVLAVDHWISSLHRRSEVTPNSYL